MDERDEHREPEPHRYLSAPWRMRYLSKGSATAGCVFCQKLANSDDIEHLVLWRGTSIAMVMNLFPYSTGHIMLLPYDHVASPEELEDPAIMTEIALEIPAAMRALRRMLGCQGFNTGMNTGGAAGAGIADHMHLHVVPRWNGDANFMPVIGNVTVMPEALAVTYAKLRAELTVEHDQRRRLRSLVLTPGLTGVLLLPAAEGSLPSTSGNPLESVTGIMASELKNLGVEATIAGWAGDDTVVWIGSSESQPLEGMWKPIGAVPDDIALLANEARSHLSAGSA
jgi:ATP adenylyltransferase